VSTPPEAGRRLAPGELEPRVDEAALGFATTADLAGEADGAAADAALGGERALAALRLGTRLRTPGYNVFFAGLEGPGREERVRDLVAREATGLPTPPDIVYVHNFDDPDRPTAIKLPAGAGRALRREMADLVAALRRRIPEALRKESFEREKEQITSSFDRQVKELFTAFQEAVRARGVLVRMAEGQFSFVPLREDGEPVSSPEEFAALGAERRRALEEGREEVQRLARDFVKQQQEVARRVREEVEATVRRFAAEIVEPLVAAVVEAHPEEPVRRHLARVAAHALANLEDFQEEEHAAPPALPFFAPPAAGERLLPYAVNLLVDNSRAAGAPVVLEDSPTYQNLFGAIERAVDQTGKLVTNHTRIRAGSLLRASGGFLVFNLDDALTEPLVWKPLKRVLKSGRLEIESSNPFAFLTVAGMSPEPVAVDARLVVTGSRYAYALLAAYDPDFGDIFKVLADVVPQEARSAAVELAYARRVAATARAEGLPHFTRDGVAELLRLGARAAGDRDKVSSDLTGVDDLVREAGLVAAERGAAVVDAAVLREAVDRRAYRANWIEERVRDLVADGTLLLDLAGTRVGQVNGLAVVQFGGYAFGRPARLSASVALGSAGIVNIERESRLSGSTHDKGVLIIAGFLRDRFGRDKPLSFSASLCFEQSYSGVDGDSASSAELYALLSAIGGFPLRQDLAVTGSVNQRGEVQAIGGVNEKVEGFFRTCRRVGLSGTQGVVIPEANVRNLALAPEVVAAVREGRFAVHAVRTVEEGIALLSGLPAGAPGEAGTALGAVDAELGAMSRRLKEFGADRGRAEEPAAKEPPERPPAAPGPPPPDPPVSR
jgi:lon-related putative ATP-dependent protease